VPLAFSKERTFVTCPNPGDQPRNPRTLGFLARADGSSAIAPHLAGLIYIVGKYRDEASVRHRDRERGEKRDPCTA